jgi:hypothetical protein
METIHGHSRRARTKSGNILYQRVQLGERRVRLQQVISEFEPEILRDQTLFQLACHHGLWQGAASAGHAARGGGGPGMYATIMLSLPWGIAGLFCLQLGRSGVGLAACADDRGPVHHLEVDRASELLSWALEGERHNSIGNRSLAC